MSTKELKLRSSFVLLVTATILLQHAGATSSSTSWFCTDESAACHLGSECFECWMTATEVGSECSSSSISDDWNACVAYSRLACCQDSYSANDCMGNSDFVVLYTCLANYYYSIVGGGEECSTLTCDYGSEDGVVDDDTTETDDDAVGDDGATETDDGAVGDEDAMATDDGGVGSYNATATDDGGVGNYNATATDDDATATDDGGVGNYNGTATDDGTVANDDDNSDSSANTGG
ncbi:unnamed protein product, partial [Ectocarpus sp. 8 AP-2014]